MTSFIVISQDKTKREHYIKEFANKHDIDTFDVTIVAKDTASKNTQSIGIEDIKQMQKKIFLKPIKSQTKAVILEDAQLLTTEAQNALLKVLEEPPAHTIIVLCADSKETLLPTIISRCQVIQLEEETRKLSEKELAEYKKFLEALPTMSIGEQLKKAEQLAKDKDKAIAWIGKLIIVMREKLINETCHPELVSGSSQNINFHLIKSFQSLHTLLKTTNVNPRFAIENTLLTCSK